MTKTRDKTPPHDDELERAALGSMLFDADAVDAAIQHHLQAGDFYSRAHQRIFDAVLSLDSRGLRSDIQTVIQELKQTGKLDEAGGAAYVSSLTTVIPSSANIEYYLQSVLDHSLRRALLRVAAEIGVTAYDETRDSPEILEEIEQDIFELRDNRQAFSFSKIDEVLTRTIDKIDEAYRTKKTITGIPTGFDKLNEMTSGFQPSDFVIIGARPSIGKTALALNMAAHIAFKHHIPTAFFSLEMSDVALAQRLISSEARVDGKNLRSGYLSSDDFRNILSVSGRMNEAPFYIVDMPNMKLLDLRSQARKLRAQEKVQIIFVDYLGLIGHENNSLPRHEQISEISRSLKSLARELKIPVVVLCQLNREMERTGQGQSPTLANLRDSGSIEQDADLVLFLHKQPQKAKKDGEEEDKGFQEGYPTQLIIAKQRNGPVGMIELVMRSKFALFTPLERST
ncbi:MAG: replicative DNA helicase [Treponema sp.]|jgi:replicative DNA helicase|nr:replicative DNA helicase [Treponema sp.]